MFWGFFFSEAKQVFLITDLLWLRKRLGGGGASHTLTHIKTVKMTASWRAESRRVEPVRVSGENDTPVEKKSGIRESGSLY